VGADGDVSVITEVGSKEAARIVELMGGVDVMKSRYIEWLRQDDNKHTGTTIEVKRRDSE
jgi:hypothetical protein